MKATAMMIAWTPADEDGRLANTAGQVRIGPWPDRTGWSDAYRMTEGACQRHWHETGEDTLVLLVMLAFINVVVRDGVPVDRAHRAFLGIDEYRARIAPDVPGADPL